ncbi:MAG: hypothetical protein JWM91_4751 [Rhodospirillales bacterium]|nr:hypothetical protein [Rhodospirillales bacterium]
MLKLEKKTASVAGVGKAEAIETALIHGSIAGQLDRFDEHFWLVHFRPKGPKSRWSENNRITASRLMEEGRLAPAAGLAEVEKAKADGRWGAAYAPRSWAEIPGDLQAELDAGPAVKELFVTLKGANRYAVLYRIHDAKTAKARAARSRSSSRCWPLA